MPKVSIILPVKNQEKYIEEALISVFEQSVTDFELIVINDGSNDATEKKIHNFRTDSRLRLIDLPKSRGIVNALNIGLNAAKGEYIARMDGDDIMSPDRIEKQLKFMESKPDIDLCGSAVTCFTDSGKLSPGVRRFQKWNNAILTAGDIRRNLYVDSPMVHPTFFGTHSFFQQMNGYRDTGFAEDYDFIFRAFFSGAKLAKLPEKLLKWRDHPKRETRTNPNLKKDILFRQKAQFFKEFDPFSRNPLYLFGIGRFCKALLDALIETGLTVRGVIDPTGKRLASGIRGIPALALGTKLPETAVLINALSLFGNPTPEAQAFLEGKTILNWVL